MAKASIHIQALGKAIQTLEAALLVHPCTDVVRDGILHRFEFTFELCWKAIRSTLLLLGRDVVTSSPKPLFRDALQEGWIIATNDWFALLEARNLLSHTYNESEAQRIFLLVPPFLPLAKALQARLQGVIDAIDE